MIVLISEEFFFQVQFIVEGFKTLQEDLIKEKNRAYKNGQRKKIIKKC